MAKKRRHVYGSSALRTPAKSREAVADLEKSLNKLQTYYHQLSADAIEIPSTLDDALLLHSLMALIVQNALLAVQGVTSSQIALLIGIAVWMMRQKSIVKILLPRVSPLIIRIAILISMLTGIGVVYYYFELSLKTTQVVNVAIICLLDVARIYYDRVAKGRLSRKVIVFSAIEHTLLVAGFSNCPAHTQVIVIDIAAFTLTTMTVFVQVVVILSTKYVVLHCFDSDMSGNFVRTQQRGQKLLESLWQDIDRIEPEQLLAGFAEASKKKELKSTALTSTSETKNSTCNNTSLDLTQHAQQSILNEPCVQLAILVLVQMLLVMFQLYLSAFVLSSWEMISALVISSSRLLWILGQVRRKMLFRRTIRPIDSKLKIA
ncbi:unnamed protein product [Peronospora destructor]|uniref:Uncharacterized protein n=1 Tax=Peronospora destructor TaxID=86335 RepID=A0AAV0V8K1_9STRA|nr:unnamed protein product [Peronospora destructor]